SPLPTNDTHRAARLTAQHKFIDPVNPTYMQSTTLRQIGEPMPRPPATLYNCPKDRTKDGYTFPLLIPKTPPKKKQKIISHIRTILMITAKLSELEKQFLSKVEMRPWPLKSVKMMCI